MNNVLFDLQYGKHVVGIDEVGRGCCAGPVVACSVVMDFDNIPCGIKDSKKISANKRETICVTLLESVVSYGIGVISADKIDEINILQASLLAMKISFNNLNFIKKEDYTVLVDGNYNVNVPNINHAIINGDNKSISIAASSIIAKVYRDNLMKELHIKYPYYGWNKNMGYPTVLHKTGLKKHGVIDGIHRKSFAPVTHFCNL